MSSESVLVPEDGRTCSPLVQDENLSDDWQRFFYKVDATNKQCHSTVSISS